MVTSEELQAWAQETEEDDDLYAKGLLSDRQYRVRILKRLSRDYTAGSYIMEEMYRLLAEEVEERNGHKRQVVDWSRFGF